jgi:hypothetical protein
MGSRVTGQRIKMAGMDLSSTADAEKQKTAHESSRGERATPASRLTIRIQNRFTQLFGVPGAFRGHLAYPCDLNHAIFRSPDNHSSMLILLSKPLMIRTSVSG